jgi:hypothetical protein
MKATSMNFEQTRVLLEGYHRCKSMRKKILNTLLEQIKKVSFLAHSNKFNDTESENKDEIFLIHFGATLN